MAHPRILELERTALLVIDVQEAFRNAIADFSAMTARITLAAQAFRLLRRPIIVTEQHPKGLGRTAEEILLSLPEDLLLIEKTTFSSCGSQAFVDRLSSMGKRQVAVCGIEAHICVNQTVHDLLDRQYEVHLLTDAISSRTEKDRAVGIEKMIGSGAVPSSVEMALFEMMRDSRHADFKAVQALLK